MTLLTRVKRSSAAELSFRARQTAFLALEGLRYVCRLHGWRRERLGPRLAPLSGELVRTRAALACHDWAQADAALRSHFMRRAPRFLIAPCERHTLSAAAREHFPFAAGEAARRAAPLLDHRYDLLGYRDLSFRCGTAEVDWHFDPVHKRHAPIGFWAWIPYLDPRCGDHKIIWELNRHQHWLALGRAAWLTGDRRYAAAFAGELESWMRANPPLAGINWASMLEVAFRSISWIWALHFFVSFEPEDQRASLVDLLVGLDRQLEQVARHRSIYFSPNTHLLGEGLALYVAGRVLPELTSAARWEQIGRKILIREAGAQVNGDGGHAELSTHYHRYALDFYLLALAVARKTGDATADVFAEVASRLASFCRVLARDDGWLATIGDDDGGLLFPICGRSAADVSDSLSLAAALLDRRDLAVGDSPEEVFWMLGGDRTSFVRSGHLRPPASQMFADTGYVVLRSRGAHAVLDAGHHGFLNGGHAHADALSLVLSVNGNPLLIDPGTATYTMNSDLRDRFRSTAMHNTVVIDGRPQSVPAGPFHWKSQAHAYVDLWRPQLRTTAARHVETRAAARLRMDSATAEADVDSAAVAFAYVEARHDGYLPLIHRRAVLRIYDDLWLVVDHILGSGHHKADLHWHVDPAWTLAEAGAPGTRLAHRDGSWAAIVTTAGNPRTFDGDTDGLGWYAPIYGQIVPSLTLRFSERGEAPLSVVTAMAAAASPHQLSLEPAPVACERKDGWHRTGVVVKYGEAEIVALFAAPRVSGAIDRRSLQQIARHDAELVTDARVAVLQFSRSGEPSSLALIDGNVARWTGPMPFDIAAADLPLDFTAPPRLSRDAEARSAS